MSDIADRRPPPRKGHTVALEVTTTARAYGISTIEFGGRTLDADKKQRIEQWLTLMCDGADCFIQFAQDATVTLDKTAKRATATDAPELVYVNTYGFPLKNGAIQDFLIDRSRDWFIHVQGSAAGILYIFDSSASDPS